MTPGHKDRLSAVDASFLTQEGPNSHMHVGGVLIFDGPPPSWQEVADHILSRIHLVPRYRQRLAFPPLESGRPVWIDDPDFNLEYHVRHTALPSPGDDRQLKQLVARTMSQQLDRHKPLWEFYLVEGLEGGRFALIGKNHHCLIDGISGVDLTTVLFDITREPQSVPGPDSPWKPQPEPSPAELLADGVMERAQQPIKALRAAGAAVRDPRSTGQRVTEAAEGLGEVAWAALNAAPHTPLNVGIGPHRRFDWVKLQLGDFKYIKDALGGTVNDVILAVTSGAMRRFLRHRGMRTEGLELRALVPLSIRASDEHGQLGNRIAAMRGPLPVYGTDPVERLRLVREAMEHIKASKQAIGAETLAAMNDFMPPTILAQASRLNFSTRLFNLIVTNVPGPQVPLYLRGRQLRDVFPVAFLPQNHALAVAIMSYNGELNFGLIADYDAMEDIEWACDAIRASAQELLEAARAAKPQANGAKKKTPAVRGATKAKAKAAPTSSGRRGRAKRST